MTEPLESPDAGAPPPSEVIHMPEPSYMPVTVALGVTVALVGVLTGWAITALGAAIALVAIVRWIRQVRADIADLPLEHQA
jgi:hypothetical protein